MKQQEQQNRAANRATSQLSRRSFLGTVGGSMALAATGCAMKFKKCELAADTPAPDLIAHLNHNIAQVDSWWCDKVEIKLHGAPILIPSLNAKIAVEKPRNFRLQASAPIGGGDVVDLGSNDERFWLWIRDDKNPGLMFASHDCLRQAQHHLPMPFDPDWLIDALGLSPLDEAEIEVEKHPTNPKQCFFRRQRRAPDGSRIEMVSTVDTCAGAIIDHSVSDRTGNMIALAHMGEHLHDGKSGVLLAHTVDLSWPQVPMGLRLRMGAITVNPTNISAKQFAMPEIANCPVYDIGREKVEVEQAAGEAGKSKV